MLCTICSTPLDGNFGTERDWREKTGGIFGVGVPEIAENFNAQR